MSYGVDVNKTRLDDLDRVILRDSLSEPFNKKTVCNMGCGESSLSVALCGIGHFVYNYDRRDLHDFFALTSELFQRQKFTQINISDIKKHNIPQRIDVVVFQRVLHYVPYSQAQNILRLVSHNTTPEGKIYISLSGLDSEIGQEYTAGQVPIESRMGTITSNNQDNFNITEKICLYSKEEAQQLIESIAGLRIQKIWVSQFGNIKIIIEKNSV